MGVRAVAGHVLFTVGWKVEKEQTRSKLARGDVDGLLDFLAGYVIIETVDGVVRPQAHLPVLIDDLECEF
jgi:hypothetical protein